MKFILFLPQGTRKLADALRGVNVYFGGVAMVFAGPARLATARFGPWLDRESLRQDR